MQKEFTCHVESILDFFRVISHDTPRSQEAPLLMVKKKHTRQDIHPLFTHHFTWEKMETNGQQTKVIFEACFENWYEIRKFIHSLPFSSQLTVMMNTLFESKNFQTMMTGSKWLNRAYIFPYLLCMENPEQEPEIYMHACQVVEQETSLLVLPSDKRRLYYLLRNHKLDTLEFKMRYFPSILNRTFDTV